MTEEEKNLELAQKINKIIHYDFKDDIKNDIFIVLDALANATELKSLSVTETLIKNQYYMIQNKKEKRLEKIIQKQQEEIEKKDKIIYTMQTDLIHSSYCCGFKIDTCNGEQSMVLECRECIKQYFKNKVEEE